MHQALTVLRSALSNAVRDQLGARNVAALVRDPTPRPSKPRPWTVDEARRLLVCARDDVDPYYVAYVLVLVLGLRRGEALGLGWSDVDLDVGELRIACQVQRIGGELMRRTTKTAASSAPPPLPDICRAALQGQARQQAAARAAVGAAWHDTGLVVTSRYGTVHPHVAMQILRHVQIAVTMNVYSEVSSTETREALRRLGAQLEGP